MVGDKRRIGVGQDHPLLLAMRLENVFFSVPARLCLSLARSTMCSSTTFSSSRRRLHLAKPSGAGERVSADQFCFRRAVENPPPGRVRSCICGLTPPRTPSSTSLAPGPLDGGSIAGVQRRGRSAVAPAFARIHYVRLQQDARLRQQLERNACLCRDQLVESIAFLRVEP